MKFCNTIAQLADYRNLAAARLFTAAAARLRSRSLSEEQLLSAAARTLH
jgi:hypothetical protein